MLAQRIRTIIKDWGKSIVVDEGLIDDLAQAILSAVEENFEANGWKKSSPEKECTCCKNSGEENPLYPCPIHGKKEEVCPVCQGTKKNAWDEPCSCQSGKKEEVCYCNCKEPLVKKIGMMITDRCEFCGGKLNPFQPLPKRIEDRVEAIEDELERANTLIVKLVDRLGKLEAHNKGEV